MSALETERIILRKWTEADAESMLRDVLSSQSGKSWEEGQIALISQIITEAHGALDEAK